MDKSININGISIHYTIEGEGEQTAVLMHGWGCDHTTLRSIEQVVLSAGLRTINVDFPGFGQSSEPPQVWGVEQYTSTIEQLLQAEKITNPVLLGHSFGGRVGILYASRNATSKLILVDAAGVKPRRSAKYYFKVYSYKAVKHALPLILGRKRGETILNRYRAKVGSSDYSNASPIMRAILSRVVNEDLKHVMPKISCPTLLIWGKNDTATPLADAKIMERLIPDAGLVAIDGAGHYSFLDNPPIVAAVLRSFLAS